MSKTIKIIDLLNKRANGEKLPQKIKYLDEYYTLYEEAESIENLYLLDGVRVGWFNHANFELNNGIEKIRDYRTSDDDLYNDNFEDFRGTINELIEAVKQLDKNIKEK